MTQDSPLSPHGNPREEWIASWRNEKPRGQRKEFRKLRRFASRHTWLAKILKLEVFDTGGQMGNEGSVVLLRTIKHRDTALSPVSGLREKQRCRSEIRSLISAAEKARKFASARD